jgi:BatD DUF11 like domain
MRTRAFKGGWGPAVLATLLFAPLPAGADAPLVYATIEPSTIAMGESARLSITDLGAVEEPINLPVVSGLKFEVVEHGRRMEFVNGDIISSNVTVVRVTPQLTGIFNIPPITPKSQPLILEVVADRATAQAPRPEASGMPNKLPRPANVPPPSGVHITPDGSAFVRLSLPKRAVYVGESVPVDIELGVRAGYVTSLNGLPALTGGDFTLNNLSHQPEREETLIDNQPFILLTWHSVIAAIKPGAFTLSASAPVTVKIRTESRAEAQFDDLMGDPFLHRLFGATIPKNITVTSPPTELTVQALPTEGRPASFSGAVGTFTIASDISSTTAAVGDPLTLRMHVIGSGNFDRVDSPMLEHLDQWKTYPPKSSFKASDAIGRRGEKMFEQPVIAAKAGVQTLPGLSFSYFDTTSHRYETARSAAIDVTISPSLADAAPANMAGAPAAGLLDRLRPDHAVAANLTNSLLPPYMQPRFLAVPCVLTLAFAGAWFGLRRRDSGPGIAGRVVSQALNRLLTAMEQAAQSGDSPAFFGAARHALQQTLAARWQTAPEQVTAIHLDARLGGDANDVRRLFALADEIEYSGYRPTATDFSRWMQLVRKQISNENPS